MKRHLGGVSIEPNITHELAYGICTVSLRTSGAFRQPRDCAVKDKYEEELESEWHTPCCWPAEEREAVCSAGSLASSRYGLVARFLHPVGQRETGDVHDHLNDDKLASP